LGRTEVKRLSASARYHQQRHEERTESGRRGLLGNSAETVQGGNYLTGTMDLSRAMESTKRGKKKKGEKTTSWHSPLTVNYQGKRGGTEKKRERKRKKKTFNEWDEREEWGSQGGVSRRLLWAIGGFRVGRTVESV